MLDLRVLADLSVSEVAEVLGVTVTTAEGDWQFARAWLQGQLGEADR
jgi:DNA-directed RNA polymerase specialized sigma24 family protein